jgi:uncharacterized protein YggU (UPF0235/DUF167 family)
VARLVVAVKPGSKRPGITLQGDDVEIRVAAAARDGAANEAVRRALAAALRVPPSGVTLIRGASARLKTFDVAGLTPDEARFRLRAVGGGEPD